MRQIFRRLHTKFVVILLLCLVIFVGIFLLYGIRRSKRIIEEQTSTFGVALTESITEACSDFLYVKDYTKITAIIEAFGTQNKNILSIEVYTDNRLIASFYQTPHLQTDAKGAGITEKGVVFKKSVTKSVPDETALKNNEVYLGIVHVVYGLENFNDLVSAQLYTAFFSGVMLLVEFSLLMYIFLRFVILKPLSKIQEGTHLVGDGNLHHDIIVGNQDEIGMLANSFNDMMHKLRLAEEENKRWHEILERKVRERTFDLEGANKQLREAQYQLVQSGKMAAVGMIGAGVAHELNNPLSGIIGYSQLLRTKLKRPEALQSSLEQFEKYLSHIEHESTRCKGIVDNLLHFSRKSKTMLETVNVIDVLRSTVSIMEYQLRKWKIALHKEYSEEAISIMGNGDKLEQVFINLIANAHHAMPDGGSLTIRTVLDTSHAPGEVHISFTDTGCGIKKPNLDKIFKAFFSSEKAMTNLGLGLSISRQIIEDHNGHILVSSEVGVGTIFTIGLPLKQ